jgi:hypothetical protein
VGSGPEEGPEEGDCSGKGRAGRPRRRGVLGDIAWMMRIRTFQAIVLQVGGVVVAVGIGVGVGVGGRGRGVIGSWICRMPLKDIATAWFGR